MFKRKFKVSVRTKLNDHQKGRISGIISAIAGGTSYAIGITEDTTNFYFDGGIFGAGRVVKNLVKLNNDLDFDVVALKD